MAWVLLGAQTDALASRHKLPTVGMGKILVDSANHHVLITGDTRNSEVVVANYDGRVIKTIGGLPGASQMTLDDGILYVTLYHSNQVARIDAKTLEKLDPISIDPYSSPYQIAKTGNLLWVSVGCGSDHPQLISYDMNTGLISKYDVPASYPFSCAELASSPTDDGILLTWQSDISRTELRKYRIGVSPLPVPQSPTLTQEDMTELENGARDIRVALNGEELEVATDGIETIRISDLETTETYPEGSAGVAIAPDMRYVAGIYDGWYEKDLYVYPTGSVDPLYVADVAGAYSPGGFVYGRGVEILNRAARVFVVSGPIYPEDHQRATLNVQTPWFDDKTSKRQEVGPVADGDYFGWSQSAGPRSRHYDGYIQADGPAVKINPRGTEAIIGGMDGGTVAYTQYSRRGTDIVLYDVATHRRHKLGPQVNGSATEYLPGISGNWLVYGHHPKNSYRRWLSLYNLKTHKTRRLDFTMRPNLVPGQINGNWIVWMRCLADGCHVRRYNIHSDRHVDVPLPKGRTDYAPSVAADGTVYFVRSKGRCGDGVKILRFRPGSPLTEIKSVPAGKDIPATFLAQSPMGKRLLTSRYSCKRRSYDIVESHEP